MRGNVDLIIPLFIRCYLSLPAIRRGRKRHDLLRSQLGLEKRDSDQAVGLKFLSQNGLEPNRKLNPTGSQGSRFTDQPALTSTVSAKEIQKVLQLLAWFRRSFFSTWQSRQPPGNAPGLGDVSVGRRIARSVSSRAA